MEKECKRLYDAKPDYDAMLKLPQALSQTLDYTCSFLSRWLIRRAGGSRAIPITLWLCQVRPGCGVATVTEVAFAWNPALAVSRSRDNHGIASGRSITLWLWRCPFFSLAGVLPW
jgi:hypothetical protein